MLQCVMIAGVLFLRDTDYSGVRSFYSIGAFSVKGDELRGQVDGVNTKDWTLPPEWQGLDTVTVLRLCEQQALADSKETIELKD